MADLTGVRKRWSIAKTSHSKVRDISKELAAARSEVWTDQIPLNEYEIEAVAPSKMEQCEFLRAPTSGHIG
jgi:hypothetical protein